MTTKLDRAVKQTLKKWDFILDSAMGIETGSIPTCGFCHEYQDTRGFGISVCRRCPVYKLEKDHCIQAVYAFAGISAFEPSRTYPLPAVLAILVYVHGFKNGGK